MVMEITCKMVTSTQPIIPTMNTLTQLRWWFFFWNLFFHLFLFDCSGCICFERGKYDCVETAWKTCFGDLSQWYIFKFYYQSFNFMGDRILWDLLVLICVFKSKSGLCWHFSNHELEVARSFNCHWKQKLTQKRSSATSTTIMAVGSLFKRVSWVTIGTGSATTKKIGSHNFLVLVKSFL